MSLRTVSNLQVGSRVVLRFALFPGGKPPSLFCPLGYNAQGAQCRVRLIGMILILNTCTTSGGAESYRLSYLGEDKW